jgi:hypothetical protein
MDIVAWYAITLGGLIAFYVAAYAVLFISNIFKRVGRLYFLKYLFYPQIPQYLRASRKTTWFDILVIIAFLSANAFALRIGVTDTPGFIKRSGLLSTVHIIPLFLGGQMNIIASRCGVSLGVYTRMHRWLGRVAIAEGILHFTTAWLTYKPDFNTRPDITGLIVSTFK